MHQHKGLTLVELLVTMAVAAVLLAVAAPTFPALVQSAGISTAVNNFMSDMRFARSEAVRRAGPVVLCRSDAPEAAPPACNTSLGPGNAGWVSGWIVFADRDGDGAFGTGDQLLRVQSAIAGPRKILEGTSLSTSKFKFTALGRFRGISSAATLVFGSTLPADRQRVVCVSAAGRARIAADGSTDCTGG